mgnify:CR=1 FL=1
MAGAFQIRVFLGIHWNVPDMVVVVGGFKMRLFLGIYWSDNMVVAGVVGGFKIRVFLGIFH